MFVAFGEIGMFSMFQLLGEGTSLLFLTRAIHVKSVVFTDIYQS